ncbi:hypothetical protein ACIBG8_07015 [Nonomuraea sp. NPDC050556]|uniref:hypothetical protein n=1 Tax=Nonomuraea sp. NPDC050556 TaxID=3364369 RepID=UPI00379F294E
MNSILQWAAGLGTTVIVYFVARPFMKRHKAPFLCVVLMFIAGCTLALALVGDPITWATSWVPGEILPIVSASALAGCGLGVVLDVSDHLKKRKAKGKKADQGEGSKGLEQPTMWIAALVPTLILLVPGVNSQLTPMVSTIGVTADNVISQMTAGR